MDKPENPPATDTAKAIELLRQMVPDKPMTFYMPIPHPIAEALVECVSEAQRAKVLIGARLDDMTSVQRDAEINRAWHVLDSAITKVTKGVLNNG